MAPVIISLHKKISASLRYIDCSVFVPVGEAGCIMEAACKLQVTITDSFHCTECIFSGSVRVWASVKHKACTVTSHPSPPAHLITVNELQDTLNMN